MLILLILAACTESSVDSAVPGPQEVPWTGSLPELDTELGTLRGLTPRRAIIHLHSPWSHDACDGDGLPEGRVNEPCLADLRSALCTTAVDVAFLTDHPSHAAEQDYATMLLAREGDSPAEAGGIVVGNTIRCDDGHEVTWLPGIEDELMPVALDRHVSDDPVENDRIYNEASAQTIDAVHDAGGVVLSAHTEGRERGHLEAMQDAGLAGVEIFNLHAMFAPDIREEDLGLNPFSWLTEVGPFTDDDASGEPDLLFLGVLQEQGPSIAHWEALLARGPMVGIAGTDAHQNVMPIDLRDEERGDSYRRMLRWFSNTLLADGTDPAAAEAALAAGRVYVAFEALGTPAGFDFHLTDGGTVYEMGSEAPEGTLHVGCPTLSASSPRGIEDPEVIVSVTLDGQPFADSCGDHPTAGPGTYRVRIELVPHHLGPFLGDDPEPWLKPYPWIYGNAIRVHQV